jgi:NitT/TauT family transport system ATP-binding protein
MAMVFQEPILLPWRTAVQNLMLIHPDLPKKAALDAFESVGLGNKSTYFPGQLSLGQQRRLSLARAFAGQPALLIMDEPFASIDPETAETMLVLTEALIATNRPATLFVIHAKVEADRLAQRVLFLERREGGAVLESA